MIKITAEPIDYVAVTDLVRSPLAGAVCTFLGTVREFTGDRRTVALARVTKRAALPRTAT